jgi:hypothetical protein
MTRFVHGWTLLLLAAIAGAPGAGASAQDRPRRDGEASHPARCGVGIPRDEQRGYVPLPRGDVFCPLLADPKAVQSFVSYLREGSQAEAPDTSIHIGSVGLGDSFGLGRWGGSRPGDGVQLSLIGAVFAQFDLETTSYDLLNADYVIGLATTMRGQWFSSRLRVYHQSSHLGDEFLLREGEPPERENLTFESAELLLSVDGGLVRIYGGGEVLFNREPDDLARHVAHVGGELRPVPPILSLGDLGGFRFVAAVDLKATEDHDWDPSVSARAGFEYDRPGETALPARRWRILGEYYRGPSPYGQFFRESVQHFGVGLHFGL